MADTNKLTVSEILLKTSIDTDVYNDINEIVKTLTAELKKISKSADPARFKKISESLALWNDALSKSKENIKDIANTYENIRKTNEQADKERTQADAKRLEEKSKLLTEEKKQVISAKEAYKIADRQRRLDQQKVNHEKSIARQQALRLQREKKITTEKKKQAKEEESIGKQLKGAFSSAFKIQKIANRLAFVVTAFLSYGIFNAIGRSLKSIVSTTVEWEAELSKVFGLLRNTDNLARESLADNVRTLMKQYGQGLTQSTRAVYDILSARFSPDEVGIISEASAQLAIAEFTDIAKSVDVVTTTLNAFNMQGKEAQVVVAGLSNLITDGKTRLEELAPVIGKLYSIAGELNFSFQETNAALSVLTQKGIKTNVAITALRQLMFTLQNPTEKNAKLLKEYGIQIDNATIKEKGLAGVLEQLNGAQKEFLIEITGTRRGAMALLPLIGDMTSYYEALDNQLNNTEETQRKFEERNETLDQQFKRLRGTLKSTVAEMGTMFTPVLKILTQIGTALVSFEGISAAAILAATAINPILGAGLVIATAVVEVARDMTKAKREESEALLEQSEILLGYSGALLKVQEALDKGDAELAFEEYAEAIGNSKATVDDLKSSIDALTESEDLAYVNAKKQKDLADEMAETYGTESEEYRNALSLYNKLLDVALDGTTERIVLEKLLGEITESNKFKIISEAKEELELANALYKLEKERYNLEVQLYGLTREGISDQVGEIDKLIAAQEKLNETQTDPKLIAEGETAVLKLQAEKQKLLAKIATLNKKDLDLAKARYKAGETNSAQMLSAYKVYLNTLKEGTLEWYNAKAAMDAFKSSLVDLNAGLSFENMASLRAYIYEAVALGEANISGTIMDIARNSDMTPEQLRELLTLLREVIDEYDEASGGGGQESKISFLGALGIKEYQDEAEMIADIEQQLAGTLNNVWDSFLNAQLNRIETWKQAEIDALNDRYDAYEDNALATALTEEHKNNQLAALNKEKEEEQKEIEKEAAERLAEQKKRNAIYQATIDYARGLISIYAAYTGDGTYGISAATMAELLTGIYAANIAIIEATEYKASGGKINNHPGEPRGSDTVPAWLTPGEVIIQEPAARGNEAPLLAANRELAKGKSFTQFASEYLAGKISSYNRIAMPSQYYAVGGRAIGASSSPVNVDMSDFTKVAVEQINALKKQNELLNKMYKTSKKNEKNTDRLRKKSNRY